MKKISPESSHVNCPSVYGPVKSRRHGLSLGINLGLTNVKVCTWGCVYCQCGIGERRDIKPQERPFGAEEILSIVSSKIHSTTSFDSITLAGNSEPTSHPEFLLIVEGLLNMRQKLSARWTINCLSNGSELDQAHVRNACNLLDEIWIKLDCAANELFQHLNRPIARIGSVEQHIERISKLNKIFIQTLVWNCPSIPRISNWTEENRVGLLEAFKQLQPQNIHLTTVARKPAVSQIQPVPLLELQTFTDRVKNNQLVIQAFHS